MSNTTPVKPNYPESSGPPRFTRLAWVPVPLLALAIAGLWIADLRTAYESRALMVLLNVLFTWLASLCICVMTARGFLCNGQPALLMFGCGSVLWGATSLSAAAVVDRVNPTITVHNLGVLGAAACHLVGWSWRGRLTRPGQWLVVGYGGALLTAALVFWAAMAGLIPAFFVQGQGGTPVRQVVLLLAVAIFAWVAWQMIGKSRQQAGAFYYWYGLGLALVATGLTGVMLLSVQGGILGWTNRLTQYLGSAYLFTAAFVAARETGTWTLSLAAVEDAWQESEFLAGFRQHWVPRYGMAVAAAAAAAGLRLALEERFGPGLPPYITFYPAIMVVALLAGLGPCLVAMVLASVVAGYWFVPPFGSFAFASTVDRLGLVIFTGMSLLMGLVAEFARRYRHKAAAYDRESALRESQEALRESEQRYRLLFQSLQEGFYLAEAVFDNNGQCRDGIYLDVNPAFERIMGQPRDQIIGRRMKELVPQINPDWFEVFGKVTLTGEATSHQAHSVVLRQHFEAFVFRPMPGRFGVLVTDITERKRAEEAQRASEARLRRLYESELLGVIYWNMDGVITDANDKFLDMVGYIREDLTAGRIDWIAMTPSEYRRLDEASGKELKATGVNKQPFEKEYIRKDGTRIPILVAGAMLDEARFNGVAFVLDITERKRAQEALHESELRYRTLFNTIDAGFCVIEVVFDTQGKPIDYRFLEINPAFEKQTGLRSAQGKLMRELAPAHEEHWFEIYGKIALTGEAARFENEAKALNRWYDVYAYRVGAPESRQVGILFNDISAHKQAEAELQWRAAELQAANEELTRFNRVTVGRELRVIELKKQVNELCVRLRQPPLYKTELDEEVKSANS